MHWVFVAALGLSLVVESGDYSLVAVHRLLVVLASLVGRARALGLIGSVVMAHGLSCYAAGIEHMSPALAGRFLTIGSTGKSKDWLI